MVEMGVVEMRGSNFKPHNGRREVAQEAAFDYGFLFTFRLWFLDLDSRLMHDIVEPTVCLSTVPFT